MRTKDKYVYRLLAEWKDGEGVEQKMLYAVHPAYSKMEVEYTKPNAEMYFQKKLNMDMYLIGNESEIVSNAKTTTKFTFVVLNKASMEEVARCTFRKTDCEIDINHRSVKVSPKDDDPYSILNGKLDEEIDIKPLGAPMSTLSYKIRPAIQFYRLGSSKITTITNAGVSQNDVAAQLDHGTMIQNGFGSMRYFYARAIVKEGASVLGDSFELRSGYVQKGNGYSAYIITMNTTAMSGYTFMIRNITTVQSPYARFEIMRNNSIVALSSLVDKDENLLVFNNGNVEGSLFSVNGGFSYDMQFTYNGVQCKIQLTGLTCNDIYYRGLTAYAHTSASDQNRTIIQNNDVFVHGVYKFAYNTTSLRPTIENTIASIDTSDDPTEYGKFSADKYYSMPTDIDNLVPIGQDMWNGGASFWINWKASILTANSIMNARNMSLTDWYSFGGAMKVILQKLDDRIDFEETSEYSQFLYNEQNPITHEVQGLLYILQKSNLLSLDYDVSSASVKTTLRKMLQFLKYALNCYWHFQEYIVDGEKRYKFHIEHVYYYMNGGGYSSGDDAREVVDLSQLIDSTNKHSMAYHTNRWSYNVGSGNGNATRIQYHWMDNESNVFDGVIDVPEDYRILTDEVIEERTIDWFSSDIDYLLANADECSKSGFLVVWTTSQSDMSAPIDNDTNSDTYLVQNYRMSITWLLQHILLYNIGSKYVKINNKTANKAIRGVKSMRKSNVSFMPLHNQEITPDVKLKTEVGEGVIDSMKIDLTSGLVSADLLYELED